MTTLQILKQLMLLLRNVGIDSATIYFSSSQAAIEESLEFSKVEALHFHTAQFDPFSLFMALFAPFCFFD
jgi:hypothetical protein